MPHPYTYINKIWVGGDVKIAKNKTKQNKKTNSKNHLSTWEDPPEGKGYPLQYSGLESSMDCIVHGVAKSRTRLNDFHFHCLLYNRPLRQFTHIDSFNPHSNPEADTISIPLYRGVNWGTGRLTFFWGHTAQWVMNFDSVPKLQRLCQWPLTWCLCSLGHVLFLLKSFPSSPAQLLLPLCFQTFYFFHPFGIPTLVYEPPRHRNPDSVISAFLTVLTWPAFHKHMPTMPSRVSSFFCLPRHAFLLCGFHYAPLRALLIKWDERRSQLLYNTHLGTLAVIGPPWKAPHILHPLL